MESAVMMHTLGVARKLHPIDSQIIATLKTGIYPQLVEHLQNRLGEGLEVAIAVGFNKGEIQISQIVENRSPSRLAAHHLDIFLLHIVQVDFRQRILKFPHNDSRLVAPQHKDIFFAAIQKILFRCQIEIRVCGWVINTKHNAKSF